jgi:hypothetical protein
MTGALVSQRASGAPPSQPEAAHATLVAQQHWLVRAITGASEPVGIAHHLGGARVPEPCGLEIYRHGYRARLQECLVDDFPVLCAVMGDDAFAALADAVIDDAPSTDVTLNRYSRRLVRYLRRHPDATVHGRAALDLARLEWAQCEAVHAPLAPALTAADLGAIEPEQWEAARLIPQPTLRLVASRWPLATCLHQQRQGQPVSVPEPSSCLIAVLRTSDGLRHHTFAPGEGRLLARLAQGRPLAQALAGARTLTPEAVQIAFTRFIAAGLFTRITSTSEDHP